MNPPSSAFSKFWELGYTNLVPIIPPKSAVSERSSLSKRPQALGKAVGIKGYDGMWRGMNWLKAKPSSETDIQEWADMGAGVGIRTGNGIIAVDIDHMNPATSEKAIKLAHEILGPAPRRYGQRPKCLLVYRTTPDANIPYQAVHFNDSTTHERIEILSDARQFVADGIHPKTNQPYAWTELTALDNLTVIDQERLHEYFRAVTFAFADAELHKSTSATATDRNNINQNNLTGDQKHIINAVTLTPNTSALFPTYDDYIRMGAAIKGATQDDPTLGEDLFLNWCAKYETPDSPEIALSDYKRIQPPYALGAQYLYEQANRLSHGDFNIAETVFDVIPDDEDSPFKSETTTTNKQPIHFTHITEAANQAFTHANKPLIKNFLDQQAMTILYGESNSGKTFIALDIAFHIATGQPYNGMKSYKHPVIYVAAEGGQGARKRAAAIRKKFGNEQTDEAPFHFLLSPINLLDPTADLQPLTAAIRTLATHYQHQVGLVVIDTLSRAIAGGDENTSTDMGAIVSNFDRLRAHTGAHLMAVHHSGKDKAKGARGHSLLRAATDTEIEVADRIVTVTKQRDLDGVYAAAFALDVVSLGLDEDGDPVTSCVVKHLARGEAVKLKVGVATDSEADVLRVIGALLEDPTVGVSTHEVTTAMCLSRGATRSLLARLESKNLVKKLGSGGWAPTIHVQDNVSVFD